MLMNVDAARRELGGVSRTTLWRCIRAGDLEVVRIGRRVLVPEQALRAFIKASTQRAGVPMDPGARARAGDEAGR